MAECQLPISTALKKTCTSCGTIDTPQWREGPSGPRTLCNACGVKYLRHVRGLPRSSKLAAVHKPLKKCKQQPRPSKKQLPFPKTSTTAKHATCKGVSECKQEPLNHHWHDTAQDCSQPSSESAGEVCWAPQAETCDQEKDLLRIGTECAAAVNLLSMTNSHSSLQQYVAGAPAFEAMFAEPQAHGIDRSSANASCAQLEDRHKHAQCCATAEFEVCIAKKEAAVADAAMAAVAKVLAAKQATAKRAKAAVSNADKRLKQLQAQAWEVL